MLKLWSDKHFSFDFEGDEELIKRYTDFIDNIIAKAMEAPARQLRNILQQKLNKEATTRLEIQRNVPEPLLPPSLDDFTLLDLEPLEVARQITLVEYDIYKKIQPQECLNQAWSKQNSSARAPHLVALMNRFNQVGFSTISYKHSFLTFFIVTSRRVGGLLRQFWIQKTFIFGQGC